jgi:peptide/nickel transport system permease protein
MTLARTIAMRILAGLLVLWGAATLTFAAMHATSGDPAIAILGGPEALPTPQVIAQVRHDYGLDDPLPVQYARYIVRLAGGDFGESYRLHAPVTVVIGEQIGATLQLAVAAAVVSLLIAIPLALATAERPRAMQQIVANTELVLIAVPNFVIGIGLLFLFAYVLRLLPVAGSEGWRSLVLPVLTLAMPAGATLSQVLRSELERVLEQPFIVTARARGLSEAAVRLRHALRHGLIPVLNIGGYIFGFLLGGAVVTETLFARQGLGRLMIDSAIASDVPVVTGVALLAAASYVLVTLAVDIAGTFVDPRTALA